MPVRGLSRGKSRLGGVLDPIERMRLNRRLLLRTLQVIARWQRSLRCCIVVSPCARTLALAAAQGAIALAEPRPARGLNAAVARGARLAVGRGARRLLVLPSDLPRLGAGALDALVMAAAGQARAAIAPDAAGTGTNALLLPPQPRFEFSFGPASWVRHAAAARARGWVMTVCARPELTLDLDTPEDLAALRATRRARVQTWTP